MGGVSEDSITAMILAAGSRTRTVQLQRLGRGLRTDGVRNRFLLVDIMDQVGFSTGQGKARLKVWKEDSGLRIHEVDTYTQLTELIQQHEGGHLRGGRVPGTPPT